MAVVKDILAGVGGAVVIGVGAAAIGNAMYNRFNYEYLDTQFDFNQLLLGRVGANHNIKIINGNNIGCTIHNIKGFVRYGNLKVADIDTPLAFQIPPKGQNTFILNTSIEAAAFIGDVMQAFTNNPNIYQTLVNKLYFKGNIQTNIAQLTIPLEFEIPVVIG